MAHQRPNDPPFFTYEPLPNAATHIRLLQVLALHEDEISPVNIQLSIWPHITAPRYHAISYTWGNPDDTVPVLVDGKRMVVRRNCEMVLKQAKWYDDDNDDNHKDDDDDDDDNDEDSGGGFFRTRMRRRRRRDKGGVIGGGSYFWCDAICIDQGNNEEKAFQVAMMGNIYKGAERVLACVGEGAEGSEVVFSELRRREALLLRAVTALESGRAVQASKRHENGLIRIGFNVPPARRGILNTCLLSGCSAVWLRMRKESSTWPQVAQALLALAKRDYFRRVWIYQELFLGSDIMICCGKEVAPLRVLYGMLQVVYGTSKRARRNGLASRGRSQGLPGLGQCEDMVEAGSVPGLGMKHFWEAIYTMETLDCTDARDRVYSVLSLVEWATHETPIFPDYDRDAFELGVEVLRRLGTFHRMVVMRSLGLTSSCPSKGLLEARRRRRHSMALPLEYTANAPEIPECMPDKTSLLAHSFGLCVREGGGQLYLDLPETPEMKLGLFKWSGLCEQRGLSGTHLQQENTITVLVPFDTEPGNWCIFYRSELFNCGWLVLVARCVEEIQEDTSIEKGDRSRRFMIKSKGLAITKGTLNPLDDCWEHSTAEDQFLDCLRQWGMPFDVFCGAEDALCLESSFISTVKLGPDELQDELLSEYFDTRVCAEAASSFAFSIPCCGRELTA